MEIAEPLDIKQLTKSAVSLYPALPEPLLTSYLSSVLDWNARAGLVSRNRPLAVLQRLVLQSARLWELVLRTRGPVERAIDIGTGGGFPGVIWKLLSPDTQVILLDRRPHKITFLARTIRVLGLAGIDTFEGEAEDAARIPGLRATCDAAAAMAVGPVVETAPMAAPFLRPRGVFATVVPTGGDASRTPAWFTEAAWQEDPLGNLAIYRLRDDAE